ncbi:hypothetical protein SCUP515_05804 [Seiridium cupressi]
MTSQSKPDRGDLLDNSQMSRPAVSHDQKLNFMTEQPLTQEDKSKIAEAETEAKHTFGSSTSQENIVGNSVGIQEQQAARSQLRRVSNDNVIKQLDSDFRGGSEEDDPMQKGYHEELMSIFDKHLSYSNDVLQGGSDGAESSGQFVPADRLFELLKAIDKNKREHGELTEEETLQLLKKKLEEHGRAVASKTKAEYDILQSETKE